MAISKFINMRIKRVIIHQIFKRDENGKIIPPILSSSCSSKNSPYFSKIQERIVKSLGNESHSIRMEFINIEENSVFQLIKEYWKTSGDENKFIELSILLTHKLSDVQNNRKFPGGVIICVEGTVQGSCKPFFCIIKAEMQDGFSLKKENEILNFSYIDDIFMTKNEKFQKLGFFINNVANSDNILPENVDCYVFDSNTDPSISKAKAEYFYKTFLGTNFRKDSNVQTNNFVLATKKFIKNIEAIDDIKKIELSTALISYIKSDGTKIINPIDFANTIFDTPETIDLYKKHLIENSVGLESIFKDTSMLGNTIKYRSLCFKNNVKLQIPIDEFEDSVEISKDKESGETIVKIKGLILDEK